MLTIQVPSQFFYEWIEENYLSVLREAIHKVLGKEGKLAYSILVDRGTKQHPPSRIQLPQRPYSLAKTQREASNAPAVEQQTSFEDRLQSMMGRLHKQYTFSEFIAGSTNLMIEQASRAISTRPGKTAFNPLVLYGKVGLGKTHLIQAIAQEVSEIHPQLRMLYLSGEQFISQFMLALRHKHMQSFGDLYLSADVLLVDDIQFLRGKTHTQDLFFHIFNHLHQGGKQLVFTSDTSPAELQGMHERLISRFKWGLSLRMQLPNYLTRRKILDQKAAREGIELPEEVLDYLAEQVDTNVRELEGVLVSLLAEAMLAKKPVDLALAKEAVSRIVSKKSRNLKRRLHTANCFYLL